MGWSDEYLEHHGILGQKWGIRRFESVAGRLTAAGKARYNQVNGVYQKVKKAVTPNKVDSTGKKTEGPKDEEQKKGLSDKQKKMIIAGAAIAGTALAAYGGYKLYQLNNKAKEGLANDLHQKAVRNIVDGRNMETLGDSMMFGKKSGNTLNDSYNYDKGLSLAREGAYQRHLGEDQAFRAREKNFTLKEKYDYLKKGKTTDDDSQMKMHKDLIEKEKIKRADIERNYSNLRRQAELEAQKAAKPYAQTGNPYAKAPSNLNPIQKAAWNASVSLANKSREKSKQKTSNMLSFEAANRLANKKTSATDKQTQKYYDNLSAAVKTGRAVKMDSQDMSKLIRRSVGMGDSKVASQKFNQASKANDDLVNDLLKKNAKALSGF